ncbi:MAG: lytic transglycosylase domain-containing protein [Pseudomonadota bacterium]|nr:lytic transglycosylase domain-containing protein [Pseudomonadota bacterium]
MVPLKMLVGALVAAFSCTALAQSSDLPEPDAPMYRPVQEGNVAPAVLQASPAGTATNADDDVFLQLRDAVRQNDPNKAAALAARLPNYAIPGYVNYYRLKPRLRDASVDEVRAYLTRYRGMAIADRMRNDWLLELGRQRDWDNFDREFPLFVLKDDMQVKCYALQSRIARGENVAADARILLLSPPGYGDGCGGLIAQLAQANQFSTDDLLTQLRLAGEMHATGPAKRIALLLGASDTRAAQAVDVPALAMARGIGANRAEHEIYLVAIGRMARTSVKLASVALEKNSAQLTPDEVAIGWANVALAASMTLSPDAYDYWKRTVGAPLSNDQAAWKTRIALRRGDWKMVRATIEAMPPLLRAGNTWVYWLARSLAKTSDGRESAQPLYTRIAEQNSFYGQLAMEELGQLISIPPSPVPLTAAELAQPGTNPDLRRALKFFSMRLRFEGTREWNWALRSMNERQLLAAAEFARQNNILDRMVNTSERTRTEFDYTQRFPAPHNDLVHPTTQSLNLDKAWVYGLIRQESRFMVDAQSGVGASGLMQVMPATGKFVAAKIGLTDFVHGMLNDLRTNITLGANYMNMVLANADGSQVLATAAYNAGPGRSRTWRATLDQPMEAAIFIESIPFTETRGYVRNVMSNATNYAALFENKPQSLKARIGTITPRGTTAGLP